MTIQQLQEMINDSRIVLSQHGTTVFATVVEENGDEDELARAANVEEMAEQLRGHGYLN